MKINLRERFGEYCLYREQGRSFYLLLHAAVKMQDILEVNCGQVRIMSSDFLEESVGKLMKETSKKHVFAHIKFTGISASHEESIKFTIDFYYRYHRDEEFRYVIDASNGKFTKEEPIKRGKKTRKTTSDTESVQCVQCVVV